MRYNSTLSKLVGAATAMSAMLISPQAMGQVATATPAETCSQLNVSYTTTASFNSSGTKPFGTGQITATVQNGDELTWNYTGDVNGVDDVIAKCGNKHYRVEYDSATTQSTPVGLCPQGNQSLSSFTFCSDGNPKPPQVTTDGGPFCKDQLENRFPEDTITKVFDLLQSVNPNFDAALLKISPIGGGKEIVCFDDRPKGLYQVTVTQCDPSPLGEDPSAAVPTVCDPNFEVCCLASPACVDDESVENKLDCAFAVSGFPAKPPIPVKNSGHLCCSITDSGSSSGGDLSGAQYCYESALTGGVCLPDFQLQ